jgi:hypothetical protein
MKDLRFSNLNYKIYKCTSNYHKGEECNLSAEALISRGHSSSKSR